jgi:DNA-binding LacI/PurR family transcriptional regulator
VSYSERKKAFSDTCAAACVSLRHACCADFRSETPAAAAEQWLQSLRDTAAAAVVTLSDSDEK